MHDRRVTGVVVTAEDGGGNPVAVSGTVSIAIANNPGGATLGGTTTVTFVAGVATFTGLTLNKAGVGYTLKVGDQHGRPRSTVTTTPPPSTVTAGAVSKLVVTTPPPTATAGSGFGLVIVAEDSFGNIVNESSPVVLSIKYRPGHFGRHDERDARRQWRGDLQQPDADQERHATRSRRRPSPARPPSPR